MPSQSKSKVYFFYETRVNLRQRTLLKKFIALIFKIEKRELACLNYIFCTDKRLLEINRQYLKHDYYTDTITFELSGTGQPVEGEVYISVDRVRDNAGKMNESFSAELLRVMFHSALHLCGYKDKTASQIKKIREKEDFYLNRYANRST